MYCLTLNSGAQSIASHFGGNSLQHSFFLVSLASPRLGPGLSIISSDPNFSNAYR